MTIDTSAILAILRKEPEQATFATLIDEAARRIMSAVSVLKCAMVLVGRHGEDAGSDMDQFLRRAEVEIISFDEEQLSIARSAFLRFGKGRHRAGLNFGDCAAYALAEWSGEPLLFKGDVLAATDVVRVAY
ncbi:MAG: type II toxin-antitoxin system VapC family toxin [Acidobacteria bacterium]|nr:type II toxin-antitoxin system VapC family toxin [Acidobacteriota bacterium]